MSSIHDTAAAWFARLQSPNCSEEDHKRFTVWYGESLAQAQAYELVSSVWQASATLASQKEVAFSSVPQRFLSRRYILGGAAAMTVSALVTTPNPAEATIIRTTRTGQQMRLALLPEVTILLDSESSVAVCRQDVSLELLYGQIEVHTDRQNACRIINQGRWNGALSQGSYNLSKSSRKSTLTVFKGTATLSRSQHSLSRRFQAGERATILPDTSLLIDRPLLEDVQAWRSGRLAFRNTPLGEAADEMNRYSNRKIRVLSPATNLRISGYYHFGQNEEFVRLLEGFLPVRATFGPVITIMNLS